jgi:hypothetical protein
MKTYDMHIIRGERTACAIMIVAPYEAMLSDAAKTLTFPFSCILPCGSEYAIESTDDLPTTDLPCPCGNPNHWFVKYEVDPSLDQRKESV